MWFTKQISLVAQLHMLFATLAIAENVVSRHAGHWTDVWTAMPQLTEYSNLPSGIFNATPKFQNTTIRQTVKLDIPTSVVNTNSQIYLRLRLSNAFGNTLLNVTNIAVARPLGNVAGTPAVDPETVHLLTFNKARSSGVKIPPASLAVTDPFELPLLSQNPMYQGNNGSVLSGSLLTITLYLENGQDGKAITSHPGSRTTSFLSAGNQVLSTNITSDGTTPVQSLAHWYFIATVEAWLPGECSTLVVVGDSITDGRGSTDNINNRWPDFLFSHLQQKYTANTTLSQITISNQGAGGNRVLADGLGPSALSRFDRDVLSHSGVKYILVFEGVNDIGTAATDQVTQQETYEELISAYRQLIARGHARKLPVFGATITPFGNLNTTLQPYSDFHREATRKKVNDFIRASGEFDGVVDFDAVVRNPQNATMLNPVYDSGDGLHPNVEGYAAMARSFPVELFEEFRNGVDEF